MQPVLESFAPHFVAEPCKVGGSLMRVYRDTRFSRDKSPYKTHVGAVLTPTGRKQDMRRGVHEHLLPGAGEVDFDGCLNALQKVGYEGPVCFELSRHSHAAPAAQTTVAPRTKTTGRRMARPPRTTARPALSSELAPAAMSSARTACSAATLPPCCICASESEIASRSVRPEKKLAA
jgi:hypothetical protein